MSLFDGVCDQAHELKTISGSTNDDEKLVALGSGNHMFVRFGVSDSSSRAGFLAKIHFGIYIEIFLKPH